MKIYTKTGDAGETGLFGGSRVPKNHVRIEAVGTIDEANALLGMTISLLSHKGHKEALTVIQNKLFEIGGALANPNSELSTLTENDIIFLEESIDDMTGKLPELRNFILPGGLTAASILHVARSVTRRAERRVITVSQHQSVPYVVIAYLNRLSDYLFTLARTVNHEAGEEETLWNQRI